MNPSINGLVNLQRIGYTQTNVFKIGLFLLGISSMFYINVIGQLYISEIIFAFIFPILLARSRNSLKNVWANRILVFGYLWLLSQIITDLIRGSSLVDLARGWASIIFFLLSFFSLYILLARDLSRIKIYIFGVCIGGLFKPFLQPGSYFESEPWKFGFGPILTLLALLVIVSSQKGNIQKLNWWFFPLICLSGLSFYLNARSIGAFTFLTAILMILSKTKLATRFFKKSIRPGKVIFLVLLFIGLLFGVIKTYGLVVEKGWFGETARIKYEIQSSGVFGLIIGGRIEIFGSLPAIINSPIIGYGSWAKDPQYRLYYYKLLNMGYNFSFDQLKYDIGVSDLIPAHSHLFQNWIWAGLLGAAFWVMISWLILKSLFSSIRTLNPLFVLVIYFALLSGWDILFSPFGSSMRLDWALRLVVFITALTYQKRTDKIVSFKTT